MKNKLKKISLLILVLIFATTLLVGCGKTNDSVKKCYDYYGDGNLYSETTYSYDKEGRLIEEIEKVFYDVDYIETTKKVYNYNGDLLNSIEIYDLEEENKWVQTYSKLYGYDENGNQVSFLGYSVSGDEKTLFAMDITEYNASGKEIRTTSIMTDEGDKKRPLTVFSKSERIYNEAGDLIKIEYYNILKEGTFEILQDLELVDYYLYTNNSDGTVKEIKEYDAKDNLNYVTRYSYNSSCNETTEETYRIENSVEKISNKITFEYDKNNRLIKKVYYRANDGTGDLEISSYEIFEY